MRVFQYFPYAPKNLNHAESWVTRNKLWLVLFIYTVKIDLIASSDTYLINQSNIFYTAILTNMTTCSQAVNFNTTIKQPLLMPASEPTGSIDYQHIFLLIQESVYSRVPNYHLAISQRNDSYLPCKFMIAWITLPAAHPPLSLILAMVSDAF